jgi:hypothetical protein
VNDFIIYINGILVGPSLFDARSGNAANKGRYLQLTAPEDDVRKACRGEKKLETIDVLEVRASNVIKRYRYEKAEENDDNLVRLAPNEEDKLPARVRFRLFGVPNSF